jgi:hypothetical protein
MTRGCCPWLLLLVHLGHSGHCDVGARAAARPRPTEGVDVSCGGIGRSRTRVRATVWSMLVSFNGYHLESAYVARRNQRQRQHRWFSSSFSEAAVVENPGSPGISTQDPLLSARISMILGNVSLAPRVGQLDLYIECTYDEFDDEEQVRRRKRKTENNKEAPLSRGEPLLRISKAKTIQSSCA